MRRFGPAFSGVSGLLGLLGCGGGLVLWLAASPAACVPSGSAPPWDGGAKPKATIKQAPNVLTTIFEDNFDRPDTENAPSADATAPMPSALSTDGVAGSSGVSRGLADASASAKVDAGRPLTLFRDAGADAGPATIPTLDPTSFRRAPPTIDEPARWTYVPLARPRHPSHRRRCNSIGSIGTIRRLIQEPAPAKPLHLLPLTESPQAPVKGMWLLGGALGTMLAKLRPAAWQVAQPPVIPV